MQEEIRARLKATAKDIGEAGKDEKSGYGVITAKFLDDSIEHEEEDEKKSDVTTIAVVVSLILILAFVYIFNA